MRERGFSLLEVVVSLFILSALMYVASLSFLAVSPRHRLRKAAWEINSRLHYARHKAIFNDIPVRIKFDRNGYAVENYSEANKSWRMQERGFLEGVEVEANNSPTFYPEGTVSHFATINVFNSSGKYRITVAITGRIKVLRL